MKKTTFLAALLCCYTGLMAQSSFVIHPETAVTIGDNTSVVLKDMHLVNNGFFFPGKSSMYLIGQAKEMMAGNSPTSFYHLSVLTSKGVQLGNHISIEHLLEMGAPVDVQNFSILMGANATIVHENETNRLSDDAGNGGYVSTTRNFVSALTNVHPANLGIEFIQAPVLGNTTITRYNSAVQLPCLSKTINRYYRIHTANNTAQNAAIRFYYFDKELNTADEQTVVLWKSTDNGQSWTYLQPHTRNTSLNYVEITNTDVSALWTIGNNRTTVPAPVSAFNKRCTNDGTTLVWTMNETNNNIRFTIEKSNDAQQWKPIGQMDATASVHYSFTDAEAGPAYYRIKHTGSDGMSSYSELVYSSCFSKPAMLMLYPNPANEYTELVFESKETYTTQIKIYSSTGQQIKTLQANILKGSNKIRVDLLELSNGSYIIKIEDEHLRMSKPFIKQ